MILKLARQDLQQQARWRHEAPQHVRVTAIIDNIRNQTTEGWNRVCKYATETKACMHGWKALLCPYSWPWPCTGKPTHSHGKHTRRGISPFFLKKKTQPYCRCQGPITCFLLPPSQKECKSRFSRSQTISILTKFIQKITNICVSE